ncbi:MAG: DUF998 domain-containing protein [Erysipelotrichia bacterium]|nr:DUF998 domain-containing protein [Erysipelotrichia bacterium]
MKLNKLGIFGIISLISYAASVFISPIAYPGYNWLSMAVSELSAVGAPSKQLADQLMCAFSPCGIVSVMGVCVAASEFKTDQLRLGIYLFAGMEWLCGVGYGMFPWVSNASNLVFQNLMHLIVTILVVVLSIVSLILIAINAKKENLKSTGTWALLCLTCMMIGAIGTNIMPASVFGLFERFSTFSAVIFNAVLGWNLLKGKFHADRINQSSAVQKV